MFFVTVQVSIGPLVFFRVYEGWGLIVLMTSSICQGWEVAIYVSM